MTPAYVRKLARRLDAELSVWLDHDNDFPSSRRWFACAGMIDDAHGRTREEALARLGAKLATALRRRVRLDTKALAATVGRKGGGGGDG